MVEPACKKCDICRTIVATKGFIRYRVIQSFIEIGNDFSQTQAPKPMHICRDCWLDVKDQIFLAKGRRASNGN